MRLCNIGDATPIVTREWAAVEWLAALNPRLPRACEHCVQARGRWHVCQQAGDGVACCRALRRLARAAQV